MTTPADRGPNLGRVVQNEKNPLLLTSGKRKLIGYVEEAHRDEVGENSLLVVEDSDANLSLLCRILKVRSYPQQSSIAFRGISEFVTQVELDVMGQLLDWGLGSVPNGDFNGYDLRGARSDELAVAYGIPEFGLPLGDLILEQHPSEVRFRLPRELLYRSLFICGAKGSGKTTCLRSLLPKSIEGDEGTESSPAVVILDVEGEFSDEWTPGLFADNGGTVNLQCISTDPGLGTATLSLRQVHPEDFANFAPNLTLNTMLHVQSIIKELWFLYEEKGLIPAAPEILEDIRKATWRRANIHHSQRGAIERMTMSSVFSMFDQEGLGTLRPEELITPGTVSILDVSSLTDEQQRTVALYLLSTFGRYKNREQDSNGLLLVNGRSPEAIPATRGPNAGVCQASRPLCDPDCSSGAKKALWGHPIHTISCRCLKGRCRPLRHQVHLPNEWSVVVAESEPR